MADIRQVRTRLSTAHTAIEAAAGLLDTLSFIDEGNQSPSSLRYMERECHKILGRLEALEAGLAHLQPARPRRRSTIEAGGNDADV